MFPFHPNINAIRKGWLAFGVLVALVPSALAVDPPGVLVLRNGNTLRGSVARVGDYYRVGLEGATFKVPAEQVEAYCQTLLEAYETRRRQRTGPSADGHLALASWCLRQDLVNEAARELLDARAKEPGNPAIGQLELQIRQALAGKARSAASSKTKAVETTVSSPAIIEATDGIASLEVSPESKTQFVRSIQPMLIHSCSTAGCHQIGASQPMELDRWALDGRGDPDIVRHNLTAVLNQIDKDHPRESPLIKAARTPHGRDAHEQSTPLEPLQSKLLTAWIEDVSGVEPPPVEAAERADQPATAISNADLARQYELELQEKARVMRTTHEKPWRPRDEFDAEAFNRIQAEKAAAARESAAEED